MKIEITRFSLPKVLGVLLVLLLVLGFASYAISSVCNQSEDNIAAKYDAVKQENKEVVAWLEVPGTNISTAVCQSKSDDAFYQTHDAAKGKSKFGSPYIQTLNKPDFVDAATIIYGTTEDVATNDSSSETSDGSVEAGEGGSDTSDSSETKNQADSHNPSAFTELHKFEDQGFYSQNREIHVYVPGHVYTYSIAAATTFGTRHLMSLYDFDTKKSLKQFRKDLSSGAQLSSNTTERYLDELAKGESDILILSTGNTGMMAGSSCYLVVAVKTADEEVSQ